MEKLRQEILRAGSFGELTPLQERVLGATDRRVLMLAPTGTGKTVAFIIGLRKWLKKPDGRPQALVIVPSRELGLQVAAEMRRFAPAYRTATLYGGRLLKEEVNTLNGSRPDIIIGTPGRLLDHLDRQTFDPKSIRTVVIDEVDKCLDLGFMPDIKRVLKRLPRPECVIVSSATEPPADELKAVAGDGVKTYDYRDSELSAQPRLEVVEVPSMAKDKLETLEDLLDSSETGEPVIVFANHRESAERIYERLVADGFSAALYHGMLDQQEREIALERLRNGSVKVLVATDLAARGIDVPGVGAVVHYHIPVSEDVYVHRNGRTARAGESGTVYVIMHDEESQPDYIEFDRRWYPPSHSEASHRGSAWVTVVFNVGKKEKISRGDIVGFITKQGGVAGAEIGRVAVGDHYATAAVTSGASKRLASLPPGLKIKGQRFRISVL